MGWFTAQTAHANPTGTPGTVLYVSPTGIDSGNCARTLSPGIDEAPDTYDYAFCTLEHALEEAEDGDILWLAANQGPYAGVEISKSVTLVGGFVTFPTAVGQNPAQESAENFAVIQSAVDGPALTIKNITNTESIDVRLERIQVQHTGSAQGPGILVRGPISPTEYAGEPDPIVDVPISLILAGVNIVDNDVTGFDDPDSAGPNGGGVQIHPDVVADLTIQADHLGPSIFENNRADNGGALYLDNPDTTLSLGGCLFIENQSQSGHGGALYLAGFAQLNLSDCEFQGNQASGNGGSLYLDQVDSVTLTDVRLTGLRTLTDDNPQTETSTGGQGGGLYLRDAAAFTASAPCVFNNHTNTGNGGALALVDVAAVSLTGCTFTNNRTLEGDGGGLYIAGDDAPNSATVTLGNVSFINNEADTGQGGGLFAQVQQLGLTGGTHTGNQAAAGGAVFIAPGATTVTVQSPAGPVQNNTATAGNGGAFLLGANNLTLSNVTFITNTAAGAGGSLVISGTQSATLTGNVFTDNYAQSQGGAFAAINSAGVTLDTLTLTNHRTGGNGGAIFASNSRITTTVGIVLTGNRAQGQGGAVFLTAGASLAGASLTLNNNIAQSHGGGLAGAQNSRFIFSGAINVSDNRSQNGDGGAIHLGTGTNFSGGAGQFNDNIARNHGGAIFATDGTIQLQSAHFEGQESQQGRGGAVHFGGVGNFNITNSLIVQFNRAHLDGGGFSGGINIATGGATTVFSNTAQTGSGGGMFLTAGGLAVSGNLTVEDNQAALNGGGLAASVANFNITGTTLIHNNRALAGNGGGLHFGGTVVGNFQSAFTLTDNVAHQSGGGVYAQAATLNFQQLVTARDNRAATLDGGGFYLRTGAQSTFLRLLLEDNYAQRSGGGLYAQEVAITIGNDSIIDGNQAMTGDGGGLYVTEEPVDFPGKVTITNNLARRNGGGLYSEGSDIRLANASDISNNRASFPEGPGNGGGLYIQGGQSFLDNVTIKTNAARDDGGGLYVGENGRVNASNGVDIDGNQVELGRGGGIFVATGGVVALNNTFLRNNRAQLDGGGVYIALGQVHAENNTRIVANETVTGNGGGVAVINGTVAVTNSVVSNNRAQLNGGGIYNQGGSVAVIQNQVNGNQAQTLRGGGIYIAEGQRLEIRNSVVNNNQSSTGGGGVWGHALTVIIADSTVNLNIVGRGPGGGIMVRSDLARIHRNTIEQNEAAGDGAGLALANTGQFYVGDNTIGRNILRRDVTILSTVLTEDVVLAATNETVARAGDEVSREDVSKGAGAGVHLLSSTGTFTNNLIIRNENRAGDGGGLYLRAGNVEMMNNLVVQNRLTITQVYGSGIYFAGTTAAVYHTTVADNENTHPDPDALAIGIFASRTATDTTGNSIISNLTFYNNIVAGHDVGMLAMAGAQIGMTSTLWDNGENQWDGPGRFEPSVGNVQGDPLFVNRAAGDYRIRRNSAAFDIGVPTTVTEDIIGTPRPRAFGVDVGAYEHFYPQGLYLRVTADPAFVNNGDTIEYLVEVVNHSPVTINSVSAAVQLPGQQSLVSSSCNNSATCNFGNLAPEQSGNFTLVASASGTPPPQGFIEMQTNITLSAGNLGADSDRAETVITRLQQCRIVYSDRDYATIQEAVDAVNDFDDIPDIIRVSGYCGGPVRIHKELTLQGGWNTSFTQRDLVQFPTTIDAAGQGRGIEIVNRIAPTVDGFIITGASARGKGGGYGGKDAGGGIYVRDAYPLIRNIHIINASATYGGGIYIHELIEPRFQNVIVEGSTADAGGGLFAYLSSPTIEDSTFRNNTAGGGGGMYLLQTEGASIRGTTFTGNRATGTARYVDLEFFNIRFTNGGGGAINLDGAQAGIDSSVFRNNSAKAGGAIFGDNSPGSLTNSILDGNSATSDASSVPVLILANTAGGGGAVYIQRSNMAMSFNRFTNNSASGRGGSVHIFNVDGDGSIVGNFFGFNNASGGGSAIYAHLRPDKSRFFVLPLLDIPDQLIPLILGLEDEPAAIRMDHNTFAHNGGSSTVYFYGEGRGFMVNNIIAFNSGTAVRAQSEILPFIVLIAPIPWIGVLPLPYPVFYNPVISTDTTLWYPSVSAQGQLGGRVNQIDSSVGNPHFKDDGYHIKRISAAFGAGKNIGGGADLDGDARPQGTFADIGVDEYAPATPIRYVAPNGSDNGGNFCRDYLNPCNNLQVAIDSALDGDIIKLAGGTYSGGLSTRDGQTQMGYITKTVTIQGGYYPFTTNNNVTDGRFTEHDWEVPFPDLNPTILDAGGQGRIFYIHDPERVDQEGNPIEVRPIISGVQLRNGDAGTMRGPEANTFPAGGGIYIDRAKAELNDVLVSSSRAAYGGGIYILESDVDMRDVRLQNNTATARGGGLYLDQADEMIINTLLVENNLAPRGAGIYIFQSDAILADNQIRNNGGPNTLAGGGIYIEEGAPRFENHIITGNRANQGGGVFIDDSDAQFEVNTIANNTAFPTNPEGKGGGFYILGGGGQLLENTIEQNQADAGGAIYLDQAEFQILENTISSNTGTRAGGGVYFFNTTASRVAQNTITGNQAQGNGENDGGGGLYYESSSAASAENEITDNSAVAGAGAYLFSFSNATLEGNTFRNNTADADGGGIYIKLSNATLAENLITENGTVFGNGGGVYVKLSGAQLNDNQIVGNQATLYGGGVYLDESGATLRRGAVQGNRALDGGGIYIFRSNTAGFDRVGIRQNLADNNGGGVYISLSNVPFEGQVIEENRAGILGGGVFMFDSNVAFNRNLVRENVAGESGGGVAILNGSNAALGSNAVIDNQVGVTGSGIYVGGSSPTLVHSTLARNIGGDGTGLAAETRGGVHSTVSLINTIFAGQDVGVRAASNNTVALQATLWDDSVQTRFTTGQGSIDPGPAELNFTGSAAFEADGYHIQRISRAIGVGVFTEVTRDIDGEGRPQGGAPDLGADELPAECLAVVSTQLEFTFTTVQEAINAADPGSEVRISGTCTGVTTQGGTTQLALVNKNITVRGGYTPTNWLVSYPITQPTFLDALSEGRVIYVGQNVNPTIEDLNLLNGSAQGLGGGPSALDAGGMVYVRNASPTLRRLTMAGGTAYYGGALYLQNSQSTVSDIEFESHDGTKGGAIFLRNSGATLRDNIIRASVAEDGGGIFLSFSNPLLENNEIRQNEATAAGGGLFLESSPAILRGNIVAGNKAEAAGGIYVDGSSPQLIRNYFLENEAQNGGGVYLFGVTSVVNGNRIRNNSASIGGGVYIQGGQPDFYNNVVADNTGQIEAPGLYVLSSSFPMRHNTIVANTGGDGSGLYITDLGINPSQIGFINNIVAQHTVGITLTAGNQIDLSHTLYHENGTNVGGRGIVEQGAGNFSAPPQFANPAEGNYRLSGTSPAVDAGIDAGIAEDMDGQNRPADNGFDIGADEFVLLGLRITIQTIPDPVVAGQPVSFIVRAVNQGNVPLDATIVAELPDSVIPSGLFTFTATIQPGDSWSESINAVVRAGFVGAMEIKVRVDTDSGLSDEVTVTAFSEQADYAIALTAEAVPSPAPKGGQLRYRINLANVGNLAVNPTVTASLPDGVSYAGEREWHADQLTPGSSWGRSIDVLVDADAAGMLAARFSATSPEGATADFTLNVPVADPGLVIWRTVEPNPPVAGKPFTYTVYITNTGNVDFTTTITNFMPTDASGRPVVAPGGPIIFDNIVIQAGETWIRSIVGVVESGYAGPLNSSAVVGTDSGLTFVFADDNVNSVLPDIRPTIVAVNSGPWNDPNTWEPARVPNADDIVLVPEGITLTIDGRRLSPLHMNSLINRGDLRVSCGVNDPVVFEVTDLLDNAGRIIGENGQEPGQPGCSLEMDVGTLNNSGLIRAGNGAEGDGSVPLNGGDGGSVVISGQIAANTGEILAGDGGNVPQPFGGANGGAGGNVLVFAGPEEPGMLINRGQIRAGAGGFGFNGGNGGDMVLLATSLLLIDGGEQSGGSGGAGDTGNGGSNGQDGATTLAGATIWFNGEVTQAEPGFAFSILGPASRQLTAGTRLVIPYIFLNRGLSNDAYSLIWNNSSRWDLTGLPGSVNVSGLRFGVLLVSTRVPGNLQVGDQTILRLSARSQGNPRLAVDRAVRLRIVGESTVYVPLITRSTTLQTTVPTPAEPPQPPPPIGSTQIQLYISGISR